ncbi:MAG: tetratricopeptide repeat protein [Rhodospirillaceae bacterium]
MPETVAALLNEAVAHHRDGRLDDAAALYRRILAAAPDNADALHLLGVTFLQAGRAGDAEPLIARAVAANPSHAMAVQNLGVALETLGRADAAIAAYGRAAALDPANPQPRFNLANALSAAGRLDDAVAAYDAAIERAPGFAPAHFNRGNALARLGRTVEAVAAYERAAAADPDDGAAFYNLGNALKEIGRFAAAADAYRRATALMPQHAGGVNNLGIALKELGRHDLAIEAYRRAIALDPNEASHHYNLAVSLNDTAQIAAAADACRRAIALDPDSGDAVALLAQVLQDSCAWDALPAVAGRLDALTGAALAAGARPPESPLLSLRLDRLAPRRLAVARAWSAAIARDVAGLRPDFAFDAGPRDRLRIGYLSCDFMDHPIAHLTAGLFAAHDRNAVAVLGFGYGPDDGSPWRRRIAAGCDRFLDIAAHDHVAAARAIHDARVDILIDLTGPTRNARLQIAALRPAPVQAWWLGYPGTTGADFFDYVVTDRIVTTGDEARHHSERPVWLPHCYQVNDRQPIADERPARRDEGLPESGIVFASFNQPFKIEPVMFAAWMRILSRAPGSVLWLLAGNPVADAALRRAAAAHGVDPARLVFAARAPKDRHLARHALADLVLDTRVYNSHTGASDALWAGVPILTLPGGNPAARVAASIVTAIGLPQLAVATLDDYEALAVRLAGRADERAALRAAIAANRLTAPLFDTARFARGLERACLAMWDRFAQGLPPAPIAVTE